MHFYSNIGICGIARAFSLSKKKRNILSREKRIRKRFVKYLKNKISLCKFLIIMQEDNYIATGNTCSFPNN